jgi:hypothetical protein
MRTSAVHNLMIVIAAAILTLPALRFGIPAGLDADTHVAYQYHFSRQFWHGDYYPRWLADANKGYGDPIFLIQYPLPYFVTAVLRPVLHFPDTATREARELGVFCFLVMAAAGLAARFWFRKRWSAMAATLGALVYMGLPYVLGQGFYVRAATGELCAFIWMPLALALCDSLQHKLAAPALGVIWALLVFSNLLSAALFLPLLFAYAWASTKSGKAIATVGLSVTLGTGLSGIYWIPVIAYRRLFDLHAIPANLPGFELGRYFLMLSRGDWHAGRWIILSLVITLLVAAFALWKVYQLQKVAAVVLALGLLMVIPNFGSWLVGHSGLTVSGFDTPSYFSFKMLITALGTIALGLVAYAYLPKVNSRDRCLLAAACVAFLLMLPVTAVIWHALPQIQVLQFPFRLTAILTLAVAGLFVAALDQSKCVLLLLVLAGVVVVSGAFTWGVARRLTGKVTVASDLSRDVDKMYRTYVPPEHLAGFAADMGATLEAYGAAPTTPVALRADVIVGSGEGVIQIKRESPELLHLTADCTKPMRLRISQLYFPLWKFTRPSQMRLTSSADGLMEIYVPGIRQQDVYIAFDGGAAERWGGRMSLLSLLIAICAACSVRRSLLSG